jgi:hypothetical protein
MNFSLLLKKVVLRGLCGLMFVLLTACSEAPAGLPVVFAQPTAAPTQGLVVILPPTVIFPTETPMLQPTIYKKKTAAVKEGAERPPLSELVVSPEDVPEQDARAFLAPINKEATKDLNQFCQEDCVKWFWGGTENSLTLMMFRSKDMNEAWRTATDMWNQYLVKKSFKVQFPLKKIQDNYYEGSGVWERGNREYDVVRVEVRGPIWLLLVKRMRLPYEGADTSFGRSSLYTPGTAGMSLSKIAEAQYAKLERAGYPVKINNN